MATTLARKAARPFPNSSAGAANAIARSEKSKPSVKKQKKEAVAIQPVAMEKVISPAVLDAEEDEASPRDFIFHESFPSLKDDEVFQAEELRPKVADEAPVKATRLAKTSGIPNSLFRLCAASLLTPRQEELLFRSMNYAKFRVSQLRGKPGREKTRQKIAFYEQQACEARNRIVQANTRLVASLARQFANRTYTFDELLSEGIETLLRSVEKFDFSRGFRFSTYATLAIRRSLYRYLQHRYLDDQRYASVESTLINDAEDQPVESSMSEARWVHLQKCLQKMLGRLEPRERHILRQRFGLDQSTEVTTLQTLAKELGVCKERVRQLEQRAIARLREMAEKMDVASGRD